MFEALAKLLLVKLVVGFRLSRIAGQQTLHETLSCLFKCLFKLLPATQAEAINQLFDLNHLNCSNLILY